MKLYYRTYRIDGNYLRKTAEGILAYGPMERKEECDSKRARNWKVENKWRLQQKYGTIRETQRIKVLRRPSYALRWYCDSLTLTPTGPRKERISSYTTPHRPAALSNSDN